MAGYKQVEYMCKYCGTKTLKSANRGRPSPGFCARKTKMPDGKMRPHTWVINRKI